jgi:hypothetical protein
MGMGAIALLLLLGSRSVSAAPPSPAQAVERLRAQFNTPSGCEAIYREAAAHFRRFQKWDVWLARCRGLRSRLGQWKRALESVWTVGNGRTLLYGLRLAGDTWAMSVPDVMSLGPVLMDPPMRPPLPPGRAAGWR